MFVLFLAFGAAWFGFKKANLAGRNPYLWGLICLLAFLTPQLVVSGTIGFIIGFADERPGQPHPLSGWFSWVNIVCLILGFIVLLWVYWYLDKTAAGPSVGDPVGGPPPPPTFHDTQNENTDGNL